MYLEKLEINGFKSFAHRVVLEFTHATEEDKGITAIVGPNGSGKSNVADSMRWVLGEQSMKTIRAKKSEDVIFSGSSKKARLGLAEVSLHLRNQKYDTFAATEMEESGEQKEFFAALLSLPHIVLTRRLYRNGESEYLINNKKARLLDVQLLIAKARFGQKTYSVIGQGMIDHILVAGVAERKEFFDEAVGVKPLQIKRDQSLLKLKGTTDNLQQVTLLLTEIEPRLKSLSRQVKRLEAREEVEQELREKQAIYYGYFWQTHTEAMEIARQNVKEKNQNQLATRDEIKKLNTQLGVWEKESGMAEEFTRLQEVQQQLLDRKNSALKEEGRIKTDRERLLLKEGKSDVVWFERRYDAMQERLRQLADDQERFRRQQSEAEAQVQTAYKAVREQDAAVEKADKARRKFQKETQLTAPELADALRGIFTEQEQELAELLHAQDIAHVRKSAERLKAQLNRMCALEERFRASQQADYSDAIRELEREAKIAIREKEAAVAALQKAQVAMELAKEKLQYAEVAYRDAGGELEQIRKEIAFNKKRAGSDEQKNATHMLEEEQEKVRAEMETVGEDLRKAEAALATITEKESEKKKDFFALQRTLSERQHELQRVMQERAAHEVTLARAETRREDLQKEMVDELPESLRESVMRHGGEALAANEVESLGERIQHLKRQMEVIGGIDEEVIKEHTEIEARYTFLRIQVEDLTRAHEQLTATLAELDALMQQQFATGFTKINKEFQQYFSQLFDGGVAKLVHFQERRKETRKEDEDAAEEVKAKISSAKDKVFEGVEIQVTPPGKKLKDIAALSGGERALTSIALICAIISTNPSPFVVLDEVDAALDESNSERFADILKHLSHKSQFIAITHNRATMRRARLLYGVTMGDDSVSQLLSVKLEEAEGRVV